ncbi:sensor histidine kinase [Desulfobacter sp.]|uniref:sensor histidine kinase n=1 Tax=Desulfobacter sp. TaxID=2294 RepID=UPI003D0F0751
MLIALVPLVFFGLNGFSKGKQMIEEKAASYLTNQAKRNAESIKQFMIERVNDIRLIISIWDISKTNFSDHIDQIANDQHRPYVDFFIMTQSGQLVFSTGGGKINSKILEMAAYDTLSWQGMKMPKIFGMTKDNDYIPVLMLSTPLSSGTATKDRHFLYCLIDFRSISVLLRDNNMEATGEVYLVNKEGLFLSTSRFGAKTLETKIPMEKQLPEGNLPAYQAIDYRGKSVLQARRDVDPFGWIVMADQDMIEILDSIKTLEKKAFFYALITGGLVLVLAFFISTYIANMVKKKYQREKQMEFQAIQKEKLASMGLLTSGLAHELNTPLANALLYTQIALEEMEEQPFDKESISQHLLTVIDEIKHGSSVIKNLLYFSRHTQSALQTVNCNDLLTKLMEITIPHCNAKNIHIEMTLMPDIPDVLADPSTLQSIVTNLVANAIEAMPDGGVLRLSTRYIPVLKLVKIEVIDSGIGICREDISNIFNPFYSTKKPGEGTGLGLFISYEMARKLGGDLKVVSSTREDARKPGTNFTLELPTGD